jgi:hypothetical protein
MDIATLDKALDDESNASIMNTTHAEIKKKKNDILQKLQIKGVALKTMHATLIGYKYIENFDQLRRGRYIRWISLKRPEKLSLTNGAHIFNVQYIQSTRGAGDSDDNDEYEHDNNDHDKDEDSSSDAEEDEEDEEAEVLECKSCVQCKVIRNGRVLFFNLNFDENIIFQKITEQEWVILDAIDYLK